MKTVAFDGVILFGQTIRLGVAQPRQGLLLAPRSLGVIAVSWCGDNKRMTGAPVARDERALPGERSDERVIEQAHRPAIRGRVEVDRPGERWAEWSQGVQDALIPPEHRKLASHCGGRRATTLRFEDFSHLC